VADGIHADVYLMQTGTGKPVVDDVGRQTKRYQLTPGDPAMLKPREARYCPVHIMLGSFAGTIAVNLPRVIHCA
jgi:hypothetical protein